MKSNHDHHNHQAYQSDCRCSQSAGKHRRVLPDAPLQNGRRSRCGMEESWVRSLDYLVIILPAAGGSGSAVPVQEVAQGFSPEYTPDIAFLLAPVPQFRVVDRHKHKIPLVLYNKAFFHDGTAGNPSPTVVDEPVHEKEFLYTTPHSYESEVQSENCVVV